MSLNDHPHLVSHVVDLCDLDKSPHVIQVLHTGHHLIIITAGRREGGPTVKNTQLHSSTALENLTATAKRAVETICNSQVQHIRMYNTRTYVRMSITTSRKQLTIEHSRSMN